MSSRTSLVLATAAATLLSAPAMAQDGTPLPLTVGIGAGITAPQGGPIAFDTASARFRLSDSFTLSPVLGFGVSSGSSRTEFTGGSTTDETGGLGVSVGAEALIALATRGTANLQLAAGADIGFSRSEVDPDGTDNAVVTSSTAVSVYYGLGVEWFLGSEEQHFSVSAHGLNPVLAIGNTFVENTGAQTETRTNSLSAGLMWDPSARVMAHIYF